MKFQPLRYHPRGTPKAKLVQYRNSLHFNLLKRCRSVSLTRKSNVLGNQAEATLSKLLRLRREAQMRADPGWQERVKAIDQQLEAVMRVVNRDLPKICSHPLAREKVRSRRPDRILDTQSGTHLHNRLQHPKGCASQALI
jgi:hypothetical protein